MERESGDRKVRIKAQLSAYMMNENGGKFWGFVCQDCKKKSGESRWVLFVINVREKE